MQLKISLLVDSSSKESITVYLHNWNNLKGKAMLNYFLPLIWHTMFSFLLDRFPMLSEMNVISIKDEG